MATDTGSQGPTRLSIQGGEHLTVTAPSSPRPKVSLNPQIPTSNSEGSHLKASSSSSELKVPGKRAPPPPPPPRGSLTKPQNVSPLPSPSPSPLLRPVPMPPASKAEIKELSHTLSLKHRRVPTPPLSSSTSTTPRTQSPHSSIASISSAPLDSKPAIPPRPTYLNSPVPLAASPENIIRPNETSDEDIDIIHGTLAPKSLPPPIPARKAQNGTSIINGNGTGPSSTNSSIKSGLPSHSSQTSGDSQITGLPPTKIRASALYPPPPPAPPPVHKASLRSRAILNTESPAIASVPNLRANPPPPLPYRRSTIAQDLSPVTPTLPSRPPLETEKKSSRLPPPPTRTIGINDKLPPARRPPSPSSEEESGAEDAAEPQAIDLMPDSSTSSRRPPVLGFRDGYTEPKIHIHPHSGCVALSGSHVVVGHGHHIKIYDLSLSEVPLFNLDTKDISSKDLKVTCMEFRPTLTPSDVGFLLWVGTKEGHIVELDIRTSAVRATKYAAHLHPITNIFRHGRSMISLDESGKTLIFSPDADNPEDIQLQSTIPRVMRTTDKQDFVKMIDGKLWAAARVEHQGSAPSQRLPVIRIYDLFNPATTGRSLLPTEHVGAVTSAAIIPSQPGFVYIGHEEGYVSIWELDTDDGYPRCVEVMKVSMSDVLSLEGVNDRLWAGSRNGMISAYDVSVKPWLVTNCWNAHPNLPVLKMLVNHYAIMKVGRLCVASIGRDENIRLWDGLLGLDWIDKELFKIEPTFSTFRDLTVLVVSWNCDSARPDSLTGDSENFNFLSNTLHSVENPPDIIVFGFQEVIDLESRKMAAKSVFLGGKKKADDGLSERVSGAYKRWYDRLTLAVKSTMPKDVGYCVVHTENLIGLFTCIMVKNSERALFDDVAVTTIKRGMGGRYGNKGGIVARFVVGDSSICFINCHLAAGQSAVRRRNADIAGILEDKAVFNPTDHPLAYVGGGDGTMILDHEFVILNGDLNYRIDHRRDAIIAAIRAGETSTLMPHDQLLREIKFNRACRLRGFTEGPITFDPTYKYDPGTNEYDSSEKHRSPAWCDRILWKARTPSRVQQLHYQRYEVNVSDHRPISAAFSLTVKTFDAELREKAKRTLMLRWADEQEQYLATATKFYATQELL
ncbi:hypothetical protein CVT24_001189 [Panaeolus cyanescens]|uniref:Inositol polyphosphate-related phosphatase domain-containing protein n=1 Tax=Panaeolus cyanescens TaxID=181874 RepID=A0A409W6X4_9AGAR|nr:hypothetical protein CVT24_001189 [Panaeolus cyanescens]